jgi:hypothetical protein
VNKSIWPLLLRKGAENDLEARLVFIPAFFAAWFAIVPTLAPDFFDLLKLDLRH